MRIIKKGNVLEKQREKNKKHADKIAEYDYKMSCNLCGCEYVFNTWDVGPVSSEIKFVNCPQCNYPNEFMFWFLHRHKKVRSGIDE